MNEVKELRLSTHVADDCEFCLVAIHTTGYTRYEVSCWKGKGYEDCHWLLRFSDKDKAVHEFNRWGGKYIP